VIELPSRTVDELVICFVRGVNDEYESKKCSLLFYLSLKPCQTEALHFRSGCVCLFDYSF
jgi:hypothetical protein